MEDSKLELASKIRIKYGTAPEEPNSNQLTCIIEKIQSIKLKEKRSPSDLDWDIAVNENCKSAGKYVYSGLDNSDLNAILMAALAKGK